MRPASENQPHVLNFLAAVDESHRGLFLMDIYFSEAFNVPHDQLVKYGAVNISLLSDLPLFIDPFLLFHSANPEYQKLHDQIVSYICYLRDFCVSEDPDEDDLAHLFCFKEVKQTWLGVSAEGNEGRGLGMKFARALSKNLNGFFKDFGESEVTHGSHLEKLCLVRSGVGRDNISDFVTNLIKDYLLSYTERFAKAHIDSRLRRVHLVRKAVFDFEKKVWREKSYELPTIGNDYVVLTPKDMLTKDDSWINSSDLFHQFTDIPNAMPNPELRGEINNYFRNSLPKKPTREETHEAMRSTIERFPQILDFFILQKEKDGDLAVRKNKDDVAQVETVFIDAVKGLSQLINLGRAKLPPGTGITSEETLQRILFLKDVIENKGGHRFFYFNGHPIRKEEHVQLLFRLTWFGSLINISREVNDGRGPVDFLASLGAQDKSLVEFKLAKNSKLESNLEKQAEVYQKASDSPVAFKVIVFFTASEEWKVKRVVKKLSLDKSPYVILIDARGDNKPSGSKAA